MGDTPNTDEQRLAEFENKLASFRPEGFDEEKYAELTKAVVNFHEDEIKGLKINTAKMKEEKEYTILKLFIQLFQMEMLLEVLFYCQKNQIKKWVKLSIK